MFARKPVKRVLTPLQQAIIQVEQEIVHLPGAINNFRQSEGLHRIPVNDALCRSATAKAEHMVIHGYYHHIGPEGNEGNFMGMISTEGHRWAYAGENLLECHPHRDATAMNKLWEGSPGHRWNLLHTWEEMGVGFAMTDELMVYVVVHFSSQS